MSGLVIAGGIILGLLGLAHLLITFVSTPTGGPMTPLDPAVRQAMQRTGGLGLAPGVRSTLWRAWIGFNLSHSIGVLLAAALIAVPAATDFDAALRSRIWLALALGLPPIYLVVSIKYWFSSPTRGIALAWLLITSGVVSTW